MFGNQSEDIKAEQKRIEAKLEEKKRRKLLLESVKDKKETVPRLDKIDDKHYTEIACRLLRENAKISNEEIDMAVVQEMYYSIVNGLNKKEVSSIKSAILDNIIHVLNYNSITLSHKFNSIGKIKGNEADSTGYGIIKKKVEEYIKLQRSPGNNIS